jgi:hypothetical protein
MDIAHASAPRTTTVRLTAHERRLVELAARGRGVGPSTYLRRVAVAAAERDVLAAAVSASASDEPEPAER